MTEPATFTTFDDLIRAMRARRMALGLSQLAVDEMAGLATGYVAKLEASLTNPSAKNARSIGRESLPLVLGALGLELAAVTPSQSPALTMEKASNGNRKGRTRIKTLAERGQKGGRIWWARLTEKQRAARIKKMNQARAAKHRKEKVATKRSKQPAEVTA